MEKFHKYLDGATFEVLKNNDPPTNVFTTTKLNATGQRCLAELMSYNFNITIYSGKHNADADGLSCLHEPKVAVTLYPEVLKAIHQSLMIVPEEKPLVETLTSKPVMDHPTDILDPKINSTSLKKQDYLEAQSTDPHMKFIVDRATDAIKCQLDKWYMHEWRSYG